MITGKYEFFNALISKHHHANGFAIYNFKREFFADVLNVAIFDAYLHVIIIVIIFDRNG